MVSAVCGSYFNVPKMQRAIVDIGVAGPTSDGEAIRHLDQVPVCIGKLVFGIAHRQPRHQFWRSKNHTTVHAGTGGMPSLDIQRG